MASDTIVKRKKNKKTKKDVDNNIENAIKVSNRVQIKDILLLSSSSKWKGFASNKNNNFKITENAQAALSEDEKNLLVIINFKVDMQNESNTQIAEINAEFLVAYSINDVSGLTKKHYNSFAEYNAVFNAWPYLREFVQNITSKMQVPTLTIPVYRFGNDELPSTVNYSDKQKQLNKTEKSEQENKKKAD